MSFFAGGWYRCPAAASQLHVATAYWLAINGTDRQTDGRTDTVSLHIRLPIKAYSVDNNISCEENTRAKCPIVRRTSIIKKSQAKYSTALLLPDTFPIHPKKVATRLLMPNSHRPPTRHDKTVLTVSCQAVWNESRDSLTKSEQCVAFSEIFFLGLVICNSPQRVYIFVAACGRSGG